MRENLGSAVTLMEEFKREDKVEYGIFLRMLPEVFYELLREIEPSIRKQNTVMQDSLPPDMKLTATIRYLATGACYTDLRYLFRIHQSTLSKVIPEVCEAIYGNLKG